MITYQVAHLFVRFQGFMYINEKNTKVSHICIKGAINNPNIHFVVIEIISLFTIEISFSIQ